MSGFTTSEEKVAPTPNDSTVEQQPSSGEGEIESLEAVLGYKAELQKNRSVNQ